MSSDTFSKTIETLKSNPALPKHVAIIMDGNGRWAANRSRPRVWGHKKGVDSVRDVVEASGEIGIEVLTLFAFSEENWGRSTLEVSAIMKLLDTYVLKERESLARNNVRFQTIGDLSRIPKQTRQRIEDTKEYLKDNTGLILNVAISYGGRSEIVNACKSLAQKAKDGHLEIEDIDQELFGDHMSTFGLPDPDLVIRTSGELRISNFLLWQIAYSELYYSSLNWPDFRKAEYFEAIDDYLNRKRRFGLVDSSDSSDISDREGQEESGNTRLSQGESKPGSSGPRC